jgi:hypothetical protein
MGRNLVICNCTNELSLNIMNQYLNGLIQSGAWGLFDGLQNVTQGLF